uniref:Cyclin dependent protein kinase n=1 Tax=Triticum aestivum TaxID=4565 RepID=Q2L395_WHEAT|nr:cyclin dependent protein kinase [Triticum aestivum]
MAIKRVFPGDHPDFKVDMSGGAPRLTFCNRARYWSSTDYQETRALGVGAYGGVVEARHLTNGWTVAVKKPLPCVHEGAGIACGCADARTLHEAAFLAACHRHRAIVELRALSLDPFARKLSVVMECVGPNLHDVLHEHRRGRPFPKADVRCIIEQLLGARQAHARAAHHPPRHQAGEHPRRRRRHQQRQDLRPRARGVHVRARAVRPARHTPIHGAGDAPRQDRLRRHG